MLTLRSDTSIFNETEVKRSRFLTVLGRVDDETEARALIDSQKRLYPDARHHCSAYIVEEAGRNPLQHSSDDGEPAGTAGLPMLEVLRHSGLTNVAAVVTRYFGGVLLGTGGLVRAYSQAVQEAIGLAQVVRVEELPIFEAEIDLRSAGRVESELRSAGWQVLDAMWGNSLTLRVFGGEGGLPGLNSHLAALISQPGTFRQVGTERIEVDTDLSDL